MQTKVSMKEKLQFGTTAPLSCITFFKYWGGLRAPSRLRYILICLHVSREGRNRGESQTSFLHNNFKFSRLELSHLYSQAQVEARSCWWSCPVLSCDQQKAQST